MEVANLSVTVDATTVDRSAQSLDKFAESGKRAGDSADKMSAKAKETADRWGRYAEEAEKARKSTDGASDAVGELTDFMGPLYRQTEQVTIMQQAMSVAVDFGSQTLVTLATGVISGAIGAGMAMLIGYFKQADDACDRLVERVKVADKAVSDFSGAVRLMGASTALSIGRARGEVDELAEAYANLQAKFARARLREGFEELSGVFGDFVGVGSDQLLDMGDAIDSVITRQVTLVDAIEMTEERLLGMARTDSEWVPLNTMVMEMRFELMKLNDEMINLQRSGGDISGLAKDFGMTNEEVGVLVGSIKQMNEAWQANDFESLDAAATRTLAVLADVVATMDEGDTRAMDVAQAIWDLATAAGEASDAMADAAVASSGIAPGIKDAASASDFWRGALGRVLQTVNAIIRGIASLGRAFSVVGSIGKVATDMTGFGAATSMATTAVSNILSPLRKLGDAWSAVEPITEDDPPGGGGGGGGGAAGALERVGKEAKEATRLLDGLMTPWEKFVASVQEVDAHFAAGRITISDYNAALRDLAGDLVDEVVPAVGEVEGAITDWMVGNLSSFEDFADRMLDIFRNMLADIIAMTLRNRITIPIAMAVTGGGALAGGGAALAQGGGVLGGVGNLMGGAGGMLGGLLGSLPGTTLAGSLTAGSGLLGGLGNALNVGGFGKGLFAIGANAAASGGGIMAMLGAALPVVALIGAIVALPKLLKGTTEVVNTGIRIAVNDGEAFLEEFEKTRKTSWRFGAGKYGTEFKPLEGELNDVLKGTIDAGRQAVAEMIAGLGGVVPTSGFGADIKFKGLSEQEIEQVLSETAEAAISKLADDFFDGLESELRKEGESGAQALTRLTTSLSTVNRTFEQMGLTMYEVSVAGAAMASSLIDAFGGLDAFTGSMDTYLQAFYSAGERQALLMDELVRQTGALGLSMPSTRDEFRAMVESFDLLTQEGREGYATMVGLAGAFDAFFAYLEQQTGTIGGAFMPLTSAELADFKKAFQDPVLYLQDETMRLTRAFYELGFALPESRAALYDMVVGIDTSTEANQRLQKALWELSGAFGFVVDETARQAEEAERAAQRIRDSLQRDVDTAASDLARAIADYVNAEADRLISPLQSELDLALDMQRDLRRLADTMEDEVADRRAAINPEAALRDASLYLRDLAERGILGDTDVLMRAIGIVRDPDARAFATRAEFEHEFNKNTAAIDALSEIAGRQLHETDATVEALEQQIREIRGSADRIIDSLASMSDAQVAALADQLLGMGELSETELSMLADQLAAQEGTNSALANLTAALGAYQEALLALMNAPTGPDPTTPDPVTDPIVEPDPVVDPVIPGDPTDPLPEPDLPPGWEPPYDPAGAFDDWLTKVYDQVLGRSWDQAGRDYWFNDWMNKGAQPFDIWENIVKSDEAMDKWGWQKIAYWLSNPEVPTPLPSRFARGGFFGGGLRIVGEEGPELEATGPARYWSAEQTRQIMSGNESAIREARMAEELRQQRRELADIKALLAKQTRDGYRERKLFEQWNEDGLPPTRT